MIAAIVGPVHELHPGVKALAQRVDRYDAAMLSALIGTAVLVGVWIIFACGCAAASRSPRPGDVYAGLFFWWMKLIARWRHRLRVEGSENIPGRSLAPEERAAPIGPLIVVANHTAGVDPLLIQVACPFEIRWMMARDMMLPALNPLWSWIGLIGVDRTSPRGDAAALREALAHLAAGGVVGIFPEGAIGREQGGEGRGSADAPAVGPFAPGVGLLIHKSGAPVLQAIITGTPRGAGVSAFGSILAASHSCVRFLPVKSYVRDVREGTGRGGLRAAEIAMDLESRCRAALGEEQLGNAANGQSGQ